MSADNTAELQLVPPPDETEELSRRKRGRPFPAGQSGNPAGRPPGSKNKISSLVGELFEDAAEDVVAKALQLAKDGHPLALRLVLERVAPLRRDRRVALPDLKKIQTAVELVEVSSRVIELVGCGQMSIEEGSAFMRLLESHRKSIEGADLALKVTMLQGELDMEKAERARRERGRRE